MAGPGERRVLVVSSQNGVPVQLTDERWGHIVRRHPEMREQQGRVLQTIAEPDAILEGDEGTNMAARLYASTPLSTKFLVVVYREVSPDDGFILTAYFSSQLPVRRRILWKPSAS